jgi:opacity protein-like surface antigen
MLLMPRAAAGQWYAGAYLGANYTQPATVTVRVPADGLALDYQNVAFEAQPFQSPQYYGARIGRFVDAPKRLAIEFEFIHLKVFAKTTEHYTVTGTFGTAPPGAETGPMNVVVQRYSMSHGLNFLLGNLVWRRPLGDRLSFVARGGAGATLPHAETEVLGRGQQQYEWAGFGMQGGAGVDVHLGHGLSLAGEYKFTYARPTITIAGGEGRTTSASHQVTFGLAVAFPH